MTGVLLLQWQQICSRRIVASQYIPLCPKAFLPPAKMLKDMVFLNNSWQMSFWTRGPSYPQKNMFSQNFILRGSTRPPKKNKHQQRNTIMDPMGVIPIEFSLCQVPFFNIFHPLDPVAYRVEPLLLPELTAEPPAPVAVDEAPRGAHGVQARRMDWVLPSVAMSSAAQLLQVGDFGTSKHGQFGQSMARQRWRGKILHEWRL